MNPLSRRHWLPPLAALLLVTAAAAATPTVKLQASQPLKLGVRTQPAQAVRVPPQVAAFGRVLNPQPLLTLYARLGTAQATATASAAEALRLSQLYADARNASLRALQSAQVRARADALTLDVLRNRLRLTWGKALAGLSATQRRRLSQRLADGRTVLVRADAPAAPADTVIVAAALRALGGGAAIPARVIERAPNVDPALQAPAWLLRVDGAAAHALLPGQALRVQLQTRGATRSAIQVPESAIVRVDGRPYAYVRIATGRFARYPLRLLTPVDDGWAAVTDIVPGAALVVGGAAALWWAEQAPPATTGKAGARPGDGDDD